MVLAPVEHLQQLWAPYTNMDKFTLIPAWIDNHMSRNVREEITYPFTNFNGATV